MSRKTNLVGKRIRVEKYAVLDEKGKQVGTKEMEVLETSIVDKTRKPCKHCKKEERSYASSSCKKCFDLHKENLFNKKRLENKINQQRHEQTNNNR